MDWPAFIKKNSFLGSQSIGGFPLRVNGRELTILKCDFYTNMGFRRGDK
jgi:hypothetical protein